VNDAEVRSGSPLIAGIQAVARCIRLQLSQPEFIEVLIVSVPFRRSEGPLAAPVSAEAMRANQLRLYLSAPAYVPVSGLLRLGLKATELTAAQVSSIRTKLPMIGTHIRSRLAGV
jgi:hypothetical protein